MTSVLSSIPLLPSLGFPTAGTVLYSFIALVSVLISSYFCLTTYREWTTKFRALPGPPSSHWLLGNMGDILKLELEPGVMHEKWGKAYGPTFRYKIILGQIRISTADPIALNYILTHHQRFPKPALPRKFLEEVIGAGLLTAEGEAHHRQRRILNPSFSPQSIRNILPVFYDKAEELLQRLLNLVEEDPLNEASTTPASKEDMLPGGRKIDVMKFLARATVDVVGVGGFGYDFKALSQPDNELAIAFSKMFTTGLAMNVTAAFQIFVPGASKLPTERQQNIWACNALCRKIGLRLIKEKKWAIEQAHAGGLEKADIVDKDILSSCLRANMAADLKPEQRLSDDEVLNQITTFTSSTALTWILHMLTQYPDVQARLRKECLGVPDARPSMEEISALPYLGAVVHEGLRLLPPVPLALREAGEDAVIPLGTPVKGRDGEMIDRINITKGTQLYLPITEINTSEAIWGPDAKSFNPLRHISPAEGGTADETLRSAQNEVPGTWGNIMTFLGGGHNCIGYRFAIAEIKVILFVLMRGLEFEELASKPKVLKKTGLVMRPIVKGEEAAGLQLPLMVKPLTQA